MDDAKPKKPKLEGLDDLPKPQLKGALTYEGLYNAIPEAYGFGLMDLYRAVNYA